MIFSANQVTTDHLRRAAYLYQVLDDVLLVAVDPSREGHEQHLQRGEVSPHRPILPGLGGE